MSEDTLRSSLDDGGWDITSLTTETIRVPGAALAGSGDEGGADEFDAAFFLVQAQRR